RIKYSLNDDTAVPLKDVVDVVRRRCRRNMLNAKHDRFSLLSGILRGWKGRKAGAYLVPVSGSRLLGRVRHSPAEGFRKRPEGLAVPAHEGGLHQARPVAAAGVIGFRHLAFVGRNPDRDMCLAALAGRKAECGGLDPPTKNRGQ